MLRLLAFVLRVYSFASHLTLGVFLVTLAALAYRGHRSTVLDVIPLSYPDLLKGTALVGAAGIVCTLLALTRHFKFVFTLWTMGFLYLIVKGFFFGPYALAGTESMRGALWFTFGAVGAFFGAAWPSRSQRRSGLF